MRQCQLSTHCGHLDVSYHDRMISRRWSVFTAGVLAVFSAPANACRVYLMPKERLAMGYESRAISAAVLVRVTGARYTRDPVADAHPWRASASTLRVLRGAYPAKTVQFDRGWGSAACDDGHPRAKVGEHWVVYFWQPAKGGQQVWQSYPAEVAFKADPRIRSSVR